MALIFEVALTLTCAALTVGFLGTLRGIAEVRLRVLGAGRSDAQFRLDAGTALPEQLIAVLPDPRALGLLAFLSEGCAACWELIENLPKLALNGTQIIYCVAKHADGKMRSRLGSDAIVVQQSVAEQVFKHFRIDSTPVVVLHRDGQVLGTAHGSAAQSIEGIYRLWSASAMPETFNPADSSPHEARAALSAPIAWVPDGGRKK